MKKINVIMLMMLMLLIGIVSVSAKKKEFKPLPCVLTLKDGSKVSGYLVDVKNAKVMASVYGQVVINMQTLFISPTPTGKGTKYVADDAKEMELTVDGKQRKYLSLYACKILTLPKNLKPTNHRYFWELVYKGKEVLGFLSPTVWYSSSWTTFYTEESLAYTYCLKGDEVVVTYYVPETGIRLAAKKTIRACFDRFPKMDEYLQSDGFSLKDMKSHPLDLLKVLERKIK